MPRHWDSPRVTVNSWHMQVSFEFPVVIWTSIRRDRHSTGRGASKSARPPKANIAYPVVTLYMYMCTCAPYTFRVHINRVPTVIQCCAIHLGLIWIRCRHLIDIEPISNQTAFLSGICRFYFMKNWLHEVSSASYINSLSVEGQYQNCQDQYWATD